MMKAVICSLSSFHFCDRLSDSVTEFSVCVCVGVCVNNGQLMTLHAIYHQKPAAPDVSTDFY